ncbi:hypothetical protein SAMN04488081_2029 [Salimicrobium album]|uniref:Uncharacterized protein n=1 Tax=Salimicrobium album TaxID=50717 RepID=A0A1H3H1L8_9BACI|nr:hypothetical protein SAMN04488081_2029 [Salimicrobium album]
MFSIKSLDADRTTDIFLLREDFITESEEIDRKVAAYCRGRSRIRPVVKEIFMHEYRYMDSDAVLKRRGEAWKKFR